MAILLAAGLGRRSNLFINLGRFRTYRLREKMKILEVSLWPQFTFS